MLGYPRVFIELIVTAGQIYQRTLSHRDWPARPYMYTVYAYKYCTYSAL